jgi:hypothetical protein
MGDTSTDLAIELRPIDGGSEDGVERTYAP